MATGMNVFRKFEVSDIFEFSIYYKCLLFFFVMYGCRLVSLFTFYPIISSRGYGISKTELLIYNFS